MRFRFVRHFALASLAVIVLAAAGLGWFEATQSRFFQEVQGRQTAFMRTMQDSFVAQYEEASRRELLAKQESGNATAARLFANALWQDDLSAFMARAGKILADPCRAMPDTPQTDGKRLGSPEKKACFAEVGRQIMALRGFEEIDAKATVTLREAAALKITMFDLKGTALYSTAPSEIGQHNGDDPGWRDASRGRISSRLSHRDPDGSSEGDVVDRDWVATHVPLYDPGTNRVAGVVEVDSGVARSLDTIKKTSAAIRNDVSINQQRFEQAAAEDQARMENSLTRMLGIAAGFLLAALGALFAIVRRAERSLVRQARKCDRARRQLAESEKMASVGRMIAGVAHQLNAPLAAWHSNVSMASEALKDFEAPLRVASRFAEIVNSAGDSKALTLNIERARATVAEIGGSEADVDMVSQMLGDVLRGIEQMSELVESLRDLSRVERSGVTEFDINRGLRNVAYIARSVAPSRIRLVESHEELPSVRCNPSQLNQVFLTLINHAVQAIEGEGTVTVSTRIEGDRIQVTVADTGGGIPADILPHVFDDSCTTGPAGGGFGPGLAIARAIIVDHGGQIVVESEIGRGTTFRISLPVTGPAGQRKAS